VAAKVIRPGAKGDAEESAKVAEAPLSTEGRIGYVNLAETRSLKLFSGTGNGPTTAKFWAEIENSSKTTGSGKT